jgi:outer membrane protein TolC
MGDKDRSNIQLKGKLKTLILNNIQKDINIKNFHLPEHDINQMQIESLDYAKDVTYGKNFPSVKLVGDYLYNNYKKAELFSDYSHAWAVQLQLTIPLFSGFSSLSERHILNSQEAQLYRAKQDLENSLSLNQVSSLRNLQTVETSLVSALQAANLAEQSQNEAHRNYKLATIDFLQFLSVEQSALQAKTSLDQLKFQSIIAYSNYFVASGQPLSVLVDLLVDEGKK